MDLNEGKLRLSSNNLPKHVAISVVCEGKVCEMDFENIKEVVNTGILLNIPMITIDFTSSGGMEDIDSLISFFNLIPNWWVVQKNQVKISVLGKWYDLPQRLVESIKAVIEQTRDYDRFFLNFCVNYDGQEEIVDACKLIAKQVQIQKIDPASIDKKLVKENIYSSYFPPPDLIIKTGFDRKIGDLLLWDSAHSKIFFAGKYWKDFTKEDLLKSINYFQNG